MHKLKSYIKFAQIITQQCSRYDAVGLGICNAFGKFVACKASQCFHAVMLGANASAFKELPVYREIIFFAIVFYYYVLWYNLIFYVTVFRLYSVPSSGGKLCGDGLLYLIGVLGLAVN